MRRLLLATACLALGCTTAPQGNEDAAVAQDSGVRRDSRVADSAVNTSGCQDLGTLGATLAGQFGSFGGTSNINYNILWRHIGASDLIGFEGYGTGATLIGVNADLASSVNQDYSTCTHCVLVYRNCTFASTGNTCADGPYYQRSGSGAFHLFTDTSGGSFGGTFNNVIVERVNIDQTTWESTPVPGGGCLQASSVSMAGIVTAQGSSGGGTESGLRQTSGNVSFYNTCTVMTDCTGTPKCLGVTGKTGRICSAMCNTDVDCPNSGVCIKFGTTNPVGNCLPPCPSGGCGATQICKNYPRLAGGANANVCAPSDW